MLKKSRRALIIYGDGHLQGRGMAGSNSLVNVLERQPGVRVFTISGSFPDLAQFQRDAANWPVPSLAFTKDTTIGVQPYALFYPLPDGPGWKDLRMEQQFDAVLHLGGPSALSMNLLPKSLCEDAAYMKMRLARLALAASPANPDPGANLRKYCAAP